MLCDSERNCGYYWSYKTSRIFASELKVPSPAFGPYSLQSGDRISSSFQGELSSDNSPSHPLYPWRDGLLATGIGAGL